MKVIGFNIVKNEIRHSILEGTISNPIFIEKEIHTVASEPTPILMDWFESTFENILTRTNPDKIGYRLILNPKRAQIQYSIFPYAILNIIAFRRAIPIFEYINQNFVPSKLGQPKSVDVYEYCSQILGIHPPHWDKNQIYSALSAWITLGN